MEGSRPTWWKILNQTFVQPPCVLQLIWKGTIHPPTLLAFTAQFSCRILIRIQAIHLASHLDVKYLGPQPQFQFVPNKGSRPPLTHNQRRDKKCPTLRTPQCQGQTTLPLCNIHGIWVAKFTTLAAGRNSTWQEQNFSSWWQGTATWQQQGLAQVGGRNSTWQEQNFSSWWQGTATWQQQDLAQVGGRHSTWQEHDLAHVGGRHNTLLVKGYTAGFK